MFKKRIKTKEQAYAHNMLTPESVPKTGRNHNGHQVKGSSNHTPFGAAAGARNGKVADNNAAVFQRIKSKQPRRHQG